MHQSPNPEHRTKTIEQHIGFDSRTVEALRDRRRPDDVHAFGDVSPARCDMRRRRTQVVRDTGRMRLDFRISRSISSSM